MKCFLKDFLGAAIRDKYTRQVIGRMDKPIINPTNGEIIAFFVGTNRQLILPTVDIQRFAKGDVWVESMEAICPPSDIVRIAAVIEQHVAIIGNRVTTVSRQRLGQVIDIEFETNGWIIIKLDVAKKILNIPTERKLIDTRQIVRITKSEITVQDASVPAGKRSKQLARGAIAPEPSTCKSK